MSGKEATVFILDSSPSMNALYPSSSDAIAIAIAIATAAKTDSTSGSTATKPATRLTCAKSAIEAMLCDMIIQSKANEAGVVVLKTLETNHSMEVLVEEEEDDPQVKKRIPYSNITELTAQTGGGGVTKPTIDLLRRIRTVESVSSQKVAEEIGGDLVDGIIVAADALYRRTHGKKYNRRIVIFTDAAHAVRVDTQIMLSVVEGLRSMECRLVVIGLGFEDSAEFDHPATESLRQDNAPDTANAPNDGSTSTEDGNASATDDGDSNGGISDDRSENSHEEHSLLQKRQVEQLLINLARLTGGSVIAASTMQQILDSTLGKRIPKSTRRKLVLHIAPGLSVNVRSSFIIQKATIPSLKQEAIMLDDELKPLKNGLDEIMTSKIARITEHWDADHNEQNVPEQDRTKGYKYGSDCIPVGVMDSVGLMARSEVCIRIIGYTDASQIPKSLLIGPPHVLSGADSNATRSCTALSALSQAMHRLNRVAICTFVKTTDADPILGALFPFVETPVASLLSTKQEDHTTEAIVPHRPVFMQLPHANDVEKLIMAPLDDCLNGGSGDDMHKAEVCDGIIDSLMLPEGALQSELVPNPAIRAFRKTVVHRAVVPSSPIISQRDISRNHMSTPSNLLEKAKNNLQSFKMVFPLESAVDTSENGIPKKKQKFWSDDS